MRREVPQMPYNTLGSKKWLRHPQRPLGQEALNGFAFCLLPFLAMALEILNSAALRIEYIL